MIDEIYEGAEEGIQSSPEQRRIWQLESQLEMATRRNTNLTIELVEAQKRIRALESEITELRGKNRRIDLQGDLPRN